MVKFFNSETLLIASNNGVKISEIKACFKDNKIENINFKTPADFGLDSPEETESTFVGNAKLKAKFYGDATGLVALSDDTGIAIDAIGGMPGVWTADWLRDFSKYSDPLDRVIEELKKVGHNDMRAQASAHCAQVIYWPEGNHFEHVDISTPGHIDMSYKHIDMSYKYKTDVIGFRGVFVPDGFNKPLSLLTDEEFAKINHRYIALNQLIQKCFKKN